MDESAEVRTFFMLIERMNALEDQVKALRLEMREQAIPRLKDVKAKNVDAIKHRITEREVVSAVVGRRTADFAVVAFELPEDLVRQLKDNGFTVSKAVHGYNNDVTTAITWGDAKVDEEGLRRLWVRPEEFTEL